MQPTTEAALLALFLRPAQSRDRVGRGAGTARSAPGAGWSGSPGGGGGGRRRARGRSRARGGAEDLSSSSETEIESAQPRGLGDASGLWYVVVIDPRVGGGGGKGDRRSSPIGWSSLSLPSGVEHGQRLTFLISIGWEVSRPRLARSGSDSVTSATGPHCFGTQAERQPRWECPTQSAYTKMGLYDLAIADYSRVVALDGGSAHAFHNRGISQAATRVCPRERELRSPPQAARRARAARPTCRMGLPPSRRRPRRRRRRC